MVKRSSKSSKTKSRAKVKTKSKRKARVKPRAKHPRTRKDAREFEPVLPSDKRFTLAEKLLLGEELAQYSFGAAGSFQVFT